MADKKPILFVVDDDPSVLLALSRDLRQQYRQDFRIMSTESAQEGLKALNELKTQGDTVALFLSDQRMPEMLGVDFLTQARTVFPVARRALLTAYSDTEAAIRAINDAGLDYYLLKPWDPPAERLFPVLDELLDDWRQAYIPEKTGLRLIGYPFSPKSHALKDFLAGNLKPYSWLDIEADPQAEGLLAAAGKSREDLPLLVLEDGTALSKPTPTELAAYVGLNANAQQAMYDVGIVGAGPSGLAAAVYGGSEGLNTLLIERRAPGGQAGTSSRIENYLGFPSGLSGAELARRAITQATRFGIEFLAPQEVAAIQIEGPYKLIKLADGQLLQTRAVVITSGVDYRKLEAPGLADFTGAGVYYGAANTEANACRNQAVYIVGGGNSAGQAAMYLSTFAAYVGICIRSTSLEKTMSSYLIDQIADTPNIHLLAQTEVQEAFGEEGHLTQLRLRNNQTDESTVVAARALFIFIGTRPKTDWLGDQILKDAKGFVLTGRDQLTQPDFTKRWKETREPFLLETCVPGLFAAGDVRSGAMNRVASAVGEGAMAIKFVHEYLSLV